jgi:hypothetical protein
MIKSVQTWRTFCGPVARLCRVQSKSKHQKDTEYGYDILGDRLRRETAIYILNNAPLDLNQSYVKTLDYRYQ